MRRLVSVKLVEEMIKDVNTTFSLVADGELNQVLSDLTQLPSPQEKTLRYAVDLEENKDCDFYKDATKHCSESLKEKYPHLFNWLNRALNTVTDTERWYQIAKSTIFATALSGSLMVSFPPSFFQDENRSAIMVSVYVPPVEEYNQSRPGIFIPNDLYSDSVVITGSTASYLDTNPPASGWFDVSE